MLCMGQVTKQYLSIHNQTSNAKFKEYNKIENLPKCYNFFQELFTIWCLTTLFIEYLRFSHLSLIRWSQENQAEEKFWSRTSGHLLDNLLPSLPQSRTWKILWNFPVAHGCLLQTDNPDTTVYWQSVQQTGNPLWQFNFSRKVSVCKN